MERTRTCGPNPGGPILTHTHLAQPNGSHEKATGGIFLEKASPVFPFKRRSSLGSDKNMPLLQVRTREIRGSLIHVMIVLDSFF